MKTIKIKDDVDKDILKACLETVQQDRHFNIAELKKVDKICDVIENSNDIIELEDADFKHLKENFETFTRWNPEKASRKRVLELSEQFN